MDLFEKLRILGDSAKYDVACTSSGNDRKNTGSGIGNAVSCGICHSFSADGRCISLLKVLLTNYCINDCKYCLCRTSNDIERAAFTPEELADLTIQFYKRNYIEGLFLSSGIVQNADHTMEQLCQVVSLLRIKYNFNGYIHVKVIPGASPELVTKLGLLVDRMSVNIELPSQKSLQLLAPQKDKEKIMGPMRFIRDKISENKNELAIFRKAQSFAPAGQSTQMIIGATPDTDFQILKMSEKLYENLKLKRVFYSAYVPVGSSPLLPVIDKPPLLREHRLYQADWLLRFYNFKASELLDENNQNFNTLLDPKCNWAVHNLNIFPLDVNKAEYNLLLRVPGIGPTSARKIITARRMATLDFADLKKLGIVLKRAVYFILCKGKYMFPFKANEVNILQCLLSDNKLFPAFSNTVQLSLFDNLSPTMEDELKCLTGQM